MSNALSNKRDCDTPYDYVISLGRHCQCAYQIRRVTGDKTAHFFDWIGTPHDGLMKELRGDFRFFKLDALGLSEDGLFVEDRETGLIYRHHFARHAETGLIDMSRVRAQYPEQLAKRLHLIDRWRQLIRSANLLFVRHDAATECQASELQEALAANTCSNTIKLVVLVPPGHSLDLGRSVTQVERGFPFPAGSSDWKGDDSQWSDLLGRQRSW